MHFNFESERIFFDTDSWLFLEKPSFNCIKRFFLFCHQRLIYMSDFRGLYRIKVVRFLKISFFFLYKCASLYAISDSRVNEL
jgi:hypothetical protein